MFEGQLLRALPLILMSLGISTLITSIYSQSTELPKNQGNICSSAFGHLKYITMRIFSEKKNSWQLLEFERVRYDWSHTIQLRYVVNKDSKSKLCVENTKLITLYTVFIL